MKFEVWTHVSHKWKNKSIMEAKLQEILAHVSHKWKKITKVYSRK
jgi:hypothetical protein